MRYDNGEIIIKSRIEDEDWYSDYQTLSEWCIRNPSIQEITIDEVLNDFNKDYESIFNIEYPNQEQLLRWCVLLVDRTNTFLREN